MTNATNDGDGSSTIVSKKNLHQRILCIMTDVEYLQKDDKVQFGNTNYKAISEEKVTTSIRKALITHGVVILPVTTTLIKEGTLSSVQATYKIVNVDDPKDFEIVASVGQGADTQDKGSGKAMTYAFKYMILRSFCLPTGEDPDKISSEQLTAEQKKANELLEKKKAEEATRLAEEKKKNAGGQDAGTSNGTAGKNATEVARAKYLETLAKNKLTAKGFVELFGTPTNADQMMKLFDKKEGKMVIDILIEFNALVGKTLAGATGGVVAFVESSKLTTNKIVDMMAVKEREKLVGMLEYYMDHL